MLPQHFQSDLQTPLIQVANDKLNGERQLGSKQFEDLARARGRALHPTMVREHNGVKRNEGRG